MLTLIIGGSASGKSAYAESLIAAEPDHVPRLYIATMEPTGDAECRARIAKHRALRAAKHFDTLECYTGLDTLRPAPGAIALLECMGNLVANELFSPQGAGEKTVSAVLEGVLQLRRRCRHLIIVSNEIGCDGRPYADGTAHYLLTLSRINCALAALSDRAVEVISGIPIIHKGVHL